MFSYKIELNTKYDGNNSLLGDVRQTTFETEKRITKHDKVLIFEAMKSAKLIRDWVIIEHIWLKDGTIHFTSASSYWENGIIAFFAEI